MIKICALDFLKKEKFGADVLSANGEVLFSSGDIITPDILLSLYFKDIYVSEAYASVLEAARAARMSRSLGDVKDTSKSGFVKVSENEPETEEARKLRIFEEELEAKKQEEIEEAKRIKLLQEASMPKKLVFDEEQAARVAKYALAIAGMIGFDEETSKELEKAAFYHKVGVVGFTTEDATKPDFRAKVAKASYSYILKNLKFSDEVADVATLYFTNYVPSNFELSKKKGSYIPFYHIVAIASYYDEFLTATSSKDEAIMKMLRLGGNKFNIFILHKFIHRMRTKND